MGYNIYANLATRSLTIKWVSLPRKNWEQEPVAENYKPQQIMSRNEQWSPLGLLNFIYSLPFETMAGHLKRSLRPIKHKTECSLETS